MTHSVTVVLATHRDSPEFGRTVASVLKQTGVGLELIVVGDGNPDGVQQRLAQFTDAPIRYLPVSGGGLTKALIAGCKAATHPYIARIDVGDFMLPERLIKQAQVLALQPEVGLVASQMSMYTPEGYYLFTTDYTTAGLQAGLRTGDITTFVSPAHASVMFRNDVYQRAGGYRAAFYLTQDCDLWSRMVEISDLHNIDEVLTSGIFNTDGLSAQYAALQADYRRMVIALRDARRDEPDDALLTQQLLDATAQLSKSIRQSGSPQSTDRARHKNPTAADSAGLYFLARCLMQHDSAHAHEYWLRLLKVNPWHVKAWLQYGINRLSSQTHSGQDIDLNTL